MVITCSRSTQCRSLEAASPGACLRGMIAKAGRCPPRLAVIPKGACMPSDELTHRLARRDDLEALRQLMDAAISELQRPFLDERQIASSRAIMGLDTQLIEDGTYFIV